MGVYVSDGVLFGIIVPKSRIIKSSTKYVSHEEALNILSGGSRPPQNFTIDDAITNLKNIITMNNEDAIALCGTNNPYNEEYYYVGIFWEWSNRKAMKLDDMWKPLFLELGDIDEDKTALKQKVFDVAIRVVADLKDSEIKMYEVRFFE